MKNLIRLISQNYFGNQYDHETNQNELPRTSLNPLHDHQRPVHHAYDPSIKYGNRSYIVARVLINEQM